MASDAAEVSPFKSLQWGLEEKFNAGDRVTIVLRLQEEPHPGAVEAFGNMLGPVLGLLRIKWQAPTLEVTLARPPKAANLATLLEQTLKGSGMVALQVGYR